MKLRWALACAAVAATLPSACGSKQAEREGASDCPASLQIVEDRRWPAGGHRLVVRAEDESGEPWQGALDSCLEVTAGAGEEASAAAVASHAAAPGFTMLVVPAPGAASAVAQRSAVESFIAARPAEERIALFVWGSELVQVEAFTDDRARLEQGLDRLARLPGGGASLPPGDLLWQATTDVLGVGAPGTEGQRAIVVIVPEGQEEVPASDAVPTSLWVVPGGSTSESYHRVPWDGEADLERALGVASERLDRFATRGFHTVALCVSPTGDTGVTLSSGEVEARAVLKASLRGEQEGACDPRALLEARRPAVETIDLFLDDAQLARYEELKALIPEVVTADATAARADFDVQVRLGPDQVPIEAQAHMRGEHALRCARKSFTVNLTSGQDHFLQEGSATDEFHLIAMCEDAGYFRAYSADTLYAEQGLFLLRFRYVHLRLNGESLGAYLLVEQTKEELARDLSRLRGVVRRPFEPLLQPIEVKYAVNEAELLAAYDALVQPGPGSLREWLAPRLDVPLYLRWLAVNSILRNGDTMDESFFYSTETIGVDGRRADYFRVMAWDPEDQGVLCHQAGVWSFGDPYGLSYCAEAALDHLILGDPELWADYLTTLRQVLDTMTEDHYAETLTRARTQLFEVLDREGVAEKMAEIRMFAPEAVDSASVKAAVDSLMVTAREEFAARRADLMGRLAALPE